MLYFNNDSRMMHDSARREVLRQMRIYQGKPVSYEAFLKKYLRAMAFTYHTSGCNAKKYRKITLMVEQMAKNEWNKLDRVIEEQ